MSGALVRLLPSGRRLVTPELARGEIDRYPEDAYRDHVEPLSREVDLAAMDAVVDEVIATTRPFEPGEIDPEVAPALHEALRLTRREASDPGVWRFLAVVHRPDFIRHRWPFRFWSVLKSRYWAPGTRPDSNTLCRLWWIAELTTEGGDYELTRRVLAKQSLANAIFIRAIAHYRPAVAAAVAVLSDRPAAAAEQAMLRLHRHLSLVPLEGLSQADVEGLLSDWV